MKYKIEATIPTTQYGNIRPTFDVEDNKEEVLSELENLWNMFGENKLPKRTDFGEMLTSFTGEELYYNDDTHKYYDMSGNELLSGSQYAKQFAKPFDVELVSKAVSAKTGEPQDVLKAKWKLGGNIANNFGTAVHDSVEFLLMGGDVDKIPVAIRDSVSRLYDQVMSYGMTAITEVLVSNVAEGNVGRIDCLLVDDIENPKRFKILDYKTNRELKKDKVVVYTKQLEFYRDILVAHGMECDGIILLHEDGNEMKVIDVDTEALDKSE